MPTDNMELINQINNSNLFLSITFICIFGYIAVKLYKSSRNIKLKNSNKLR